METNIKHRLASKRLRNIKRCKSKVCKSNSENGLQSKPNYIGNELLQNSSVDKVFNQKRKVSVNVTKRSQSGEERNFPPSESLFILKKESKHSNAIGNRDKLDSFGDSLTDDIDLSFSTKSICFLVDKLSKINKEKGWLHRENKELRRNIQILRAQECLEGKKLFREERRTTHKLYSARCALEKLTVEFISYQRAATEMNQKICLERSKVSDLKRKRDKECDRYETYRKHMRHLTIRLRDEIRFRAAKVLVSRIDFGSSFFCFLIAIPEFVKKRIASTQEIIKILISDGAFCDLWACLCNCIIIAVTFWLLGLVKLRTTKED